MKATGGTTKPTRQSVDGKQRELMELAVDRSVGKVLTVYDAKGRPTEHFFFGCSGG